jgi:GNAT superfamily N-acetyltransferase
LSLTIRPASADEIPLILTFIRRLAEYERMPEAVTATEDGLREWLYGEMRAAETVIARWDGQPAGFALYFTTFSTFLGRPGLYLEDLFVEPEFRGRGIGKALLSYLAGEAARRGYGRVEWAVLNWNEPAIGFYRGLGAVPMSEWSVYRLSGDALTALASDQ